MFLAGQFFENSLAKQAGIGLAYTDAQTTKREVIEVKNRHNRFRSIDENIWNNPNRTCQKTH